MHLKIFKYISLVLLFLAAVVCHAHKKFVLVIDAGHGGKDYGAVGKITNEKTINLNIALEFGRLVEVNCPDVKVVYTRKTDKFVSLQRRADIANEQHADLFVSVHTNALPKGKIAYGTETYTLGIARAESNLEVAKRENSVITLESDYQTTYQGFDPHKPESYIIFELLQDKYMEQSVEMARCVQQQYTNYAGRKNKGVKQAGFLVLRATSMPSILTEVGFISTPAEERYLNTQEGVRKLAHSLYKGFLSYRKQYDKGISSAVVKTQETTPPTQESVQVEQPVAEVLQNNSEGDREDEAPKTRQSVASEKAKPVFKVQLLVADRKLKAGDRRLNGLSPVDYYQEGGMYKYTYGNTSDYSEIKRIQKKIKGKFPKSFVVAFLNGKRMNLQDAIQMSK